MWSRLFGYSKEEQPQRPSADEIIKQHPFLSEGLLATGVAYQAETKPILVCISAIITLLKEESPDWLGIEMIFGRLIDDIKLMQVRAFHDDPFDADKILTAQKPLSKLNVALYVINDLLNQEGKNNRHVTHLTKHFNDLKTLLNDMLGQVLEEQKQIIAESFYSDEQEAGSRCAIS